MVVKIQEAQAPQQGLSLFNLGFRPFFLLAAIFAVSSMTLWAVVYPGILPTSMTVLSPFQWHAHEMIYGYATAVIAGFLLTSVKNWTGLQTPFGPKLGLLVLAWVAARVAIAWGGWEHSLLVNGVIANVIFLGSLLVSIGSRIVRARNWRQLGIIAVIVLLTLGELLFLRGITQPSFALITQSLYLGFYLVLLLILIMGRRVIPFFIERGVGYATTLRQSRVVDTLVIVAFIAYALNDVFIHHQQGATISAGVVFVCQSWRLFNWHSKGIWTKPLLWSLYLALVAITAGFLLATLSPWIGANPFLVIHALAVGGIGMTTLSMMARVSLGHTGRNVHQAPGLVVLSLGLMILAIIGRVLMPLLLPAHYGLWIALSQAAWIAAFVIFILVYAPMLIQPRADGRDG